MAAERVRSVRLIAAMSVAHLLTMLGFSAFPALLPQFTTLWSMASIEAGGINSALFAGYTLSVPILVSLTDRFDSKRIYLAGVILAVVSHAGFAMFAQGPVTAALFSALYGIALAGAYMPGLRLLGEHLSAEAMARATGYYTSMFSFGAAVSYVLSDLIAQMAGWMMVFAFASVAAGLAGVIVAFFVPPARPAPVDRTLLEQLDPRPALRNRSALAYSICYGLHTLELMTVRSWVVAFLAMSAMATGGGSTVWTPAVVAAVLTVVGTAATLGGNEMAIRIGRRRWINFAMVSSGLMAIAVAGSMTVSYALCAVLAIMHGFAIMMDSATLTAGAFGSAKPEQRGLTMAVHSTIGFAGAIAGPFLFGAIVDLFGTASETGWMFAYAHVALIVCAGPLVLRWLHPQALPGDKKS